MYLPISDRLYFITFRIGLSDGRSYELLGDEIEDSFESDVSIIVDVVVLRVVVVVVVVDVLVVGAEVDVDDQG